MYVFDVNEMSAEELGAIVDGYTEIRDKMLLVGNKVDVNGEEHAKNKFGGNTGITWLSAKEDAHLDVLKRRMFLMVVEEGRGTDETVVTNARHYENLRQVYLSIEEIVKGLDAGIPGDLLSLDIRRCLHYLGEITGEITNEDQLDYIFSKFCIGK